MHWGLIDGSTKARANNLTSDLLDPFSKEPDFKYSAVRVEALAKKKRKIVIAGAGAAALQFIHSYRELNQDDEIGTWKIIKMFKIPCFLLLKKT